MKTEHTGAISLVLVGVGLVVFFARRGNPDVNFCKQTFAQLADGRQAVQDDIAWEQLRALDQNVAIEYAKLPDERTRLEYRKNFIDGFSKGFRQANVRADAFRNWRVHATTDSQTVVATEHPVTGQTLLLATGRHGKRRIEEIGWQ